VRRREFIVLAGGATAWPLVARAQQSKPVRRVGVLMNTTADDVDPAYLPAGRGFVFSSNRQTKSSVNQFNGHTYFALDEYERERVFNLHTMDAQGASITQISVNQSHDRNPVVRPNGDIMFSRWDHVGDRNHFKVFRVKPDGTDMFVLYGSHSPGNSFLHPRDMDPNGPYKGFVSSDLMPLSGTHEGGALVFIDAANYSEQNTPANSTISATGGQTQATQQLLKFDRGLSQFGRITTPYPLWDGTNRVLIAYAPCEVTKNGVVVSCATLSAAEIARLGDMDRLNTDIAADPVQDNVNPSYAIYMFNPANQTFLIVASAPAGFMYTDPVAIQSRTEPNATDPTSVDATLAAQNKGLLEVRSVYDTDGLGRMGDPMIAAADLGAGCTTAIAKTTPADSMDTRAQVAAFASQLQGAQEVFTRLGDGVRLQADPAQRVEGFGRKQVGPGIARDGVAAATQLPRLSRFAPAVADDRETAQRFGQDRSLPRRIGGGDRGLVRRDGARHAHCPLQGTRFDQ